MKLTRQTLPTIAAVELYKITAATRSFSVRLASRVCAYSMAQALRRLRLVWFVCRPLFLSVRPLLLQSEGAISAVVARYTIAPTNRTHHQR